MLRTQELAYQCDLLAVEVDLFQMSVQLHCWHACNFCVTDGNAIYADYTDSDNSDSD
jgi:hypothetical protein